MKFQGSTIGVLKHNMILPKACFGLLFVRIGFVENNTFETLLQIFYLHQFFFSEVYSCIISQPLMTFKTGITDLSQNYTLAINKHSFYSFYWLYRNRIPYIVENIFRNNAHAQQSKNSYVSWVWLSQQSEPRVPNSPASH